MKFLSIAAIAMLPLTVFGVGTVTPGETHCISYGSYQKNPTFEQAQAAYDFLLANSGKTFYQTTNKGAIDLWTATTDVNGVVSNSYLVLLGPTGKRATGKDLAAAFAHFVLKCTQSAQVGGTLNLIGTGTSAQLDLSFYQIGATNEK